MEKKSIFKKIDEFYTKSVKVIVGDMPLDEGEVTSPKKSKPSNKAASTTKTTTLKDTFSTIKSKVLNFGKPDEKALLYKEVVKREKQEVKVAKQEEKLAKKKTIVKESIAKKTTVKESIAKKPDRKKSATKKTTTKTSTTAKKETTTSKTKTGSKTATKKPATKKASNKKPVAKKTADIKTTNAKTTVKKPTSKATVKSADKKKVTASKKTATSKKPVVKKTTTSSKTASTKTTKKESVKKATSSLVKASTKKTISKAKSTPKTASTPSKRDAKIALYTKDITKHYGEVDKDLLALVVKNLGPSIYRKDAELVSCSDPKELDTVRRNFLIKKLGIEASQGVLDAGIQDVCSELKGVRNKYRATFYYSLTKKFKKESALS